MNSQNKKQHKPSLSRKTSRGTKGQNSKGKKPSGDTWFARKRKGVVEDAKSISVPRSSVDFIIGTLLLLVTLYVSVAMVHYFFTIEQDQSVLHSTQDAAELVVGANATESIRNCTGLLGARIADGLIDGFLGLGSLFLPIFMLSVGFRFILGWSRISPLKSLLFSTSMALWVSLFCAYLESIVSLQLPFALGGASGEQIIAALGAHVGSIGIICILVVSFVIVLVLCRASIVGKVRTMAEGKKRKGKKNEAVAPEMPGEDDDREEMPGEEPSDEDTEETLPMDTNEEPGDVEEEDQDSTEGSHPAQSFVNGKEEPLTPRGGEVPSEPLPSQLSSGMTIEVAQGDEVGDESALQERQASGNGTHDLPGYTFPSLDLLERYDREAMMPDMEEISENERQIIDTLESFKIKARPTKATVGPAVTLYEIEPDAGIKISKIRSLEDDIARSLKSEGGIRIIAPIPGKGTIGIEVPNKRPQTVALYSLLTSRKFVENNMHLPVAIGKTITNEVFMFDLAKMPHLLIAGATGQGKSVGLNVMITSLLYSKHPSELKFVMIDPKMLEFSIYEALGHHYLAKLPDEGSCIITDMNKVVPTLNSLCIEMDNRYRLLSDARVRNIAEYNSLFDKGELSAADGHARLPYIVLIVDEFADLIMTSGKEVEKPIARIAQKARAAGIHMVLATQRPTTDIITGTIKANFPARIAFKVFSAVDSKTILDAPGANHLVGRGDMLFYQGKDMLRLQCALVDTPETQQIVDEISLQPGYSEAYQLPEAPVEEGDESRTISLDKRDPLFDQVATMVVETQQGSASKIQRQFEIGFNRAGRIMDQLEAAGIVSAQHGSKPREVLISDIFTLNNLLESLR